MIHIVEVFDSNRFIPCQVSVGSEATMFSTISADDSSNDGLVIVDDVSPSFSQGTKLRVLYENLFLVC